MVCRPILDQTFAFFFVRREKLMATARAKAKYRMRDDSKMNNAN